MTANVYVFFCDCMYVKGLDMAKARSFAISANVSKYTLILRENRMTRLFHA